MRRGYDCDFIFYKEQLVGIALGSDATSEHEWGIKGIREAFGMQDDEVGIAKRLVRQIPANYIYQEFDDPRKSTVLLFSRMCNASLENIETYCELSIYEPRCGEKKIEPNRLTAAWDEKTFGIRTVGIEYRKYLEEIHNHLMLKNACIFLGGGHVFKNSGLTILIASLIPDEGKKAWYDNDVDLINLKKAAQDTGIEDFLRKKDKEYFALMPRWANEEKTEVMFFLNPCDQRNNNYGWFTVEDLKLWGEGAGPIPISSASHQGKIKRANSTDNNMESLSNKKLLRSGYVSKKQ